MRRGLVLIAVLLLASCASPLKDWDHTGYTVRSGDTLYSIAWRYEIDPADLASWNRLSSSALIHPGQRLTTRKPEGFDKPKPIAKADPQAEYIEVVTPVHKPKPTAAKTVTVRKNDTLYSIARQNRMTAKELIAANNLKRPYTIYPGQKLKLEAGSHTSVSTVAESKPVKTTKRKRLTWKWPIKGKVMKQFNKRRLDSKGIDIAGSSGNSVKAAAGGRVVYSGNGLISYGNLVIIKHNNTYLSAYANNEKLLVKEGDYVEQGQAIARLGVNSSKKAHLHFEIRKGGKPVNPLRYLPSS